MNRDGEFTNFDAMNEYKEVKSSLIAATILIALGISLGALGAHALKSVLSESNLESYDVAVRYQIIQGLGLFILCLLQTSYQLNLKWPRRLLLIGTILFSGSIYLLVFRDFGFWDALIPVIGPLTPIGGVLMIAAYIALLYSILKKKV